MNASPNPKSVSSYPVPPQAHPNFGEAVHAFAQLIYSLNKPNEMKAAMFIFEHTICYQEYDAGKRITLDEFVNGRKRKDGSRFSSGCGISERIHASRALAGLQDRKAVRVDLDEKDQARKKKFYRLTLPSLDRCVSETDTETAAGVSKTDTADLLPIAQPSPGVSKTDTQSIENGYSAYQNQILDQSKYLEEILEESTFTPPAIVESTPPSLAADAALEEVVVVSDSEEENLKREIAALKAEEAAFPRLLSPERKQEKMQIGMLRMRLQDRLRTLQESNLSGSQAQDNASPCVGLQEASETDEEDAHQFTIEELRETLDGLHHAYSEAYNAHRMADLQEIRIAQNKVRAAIRKLEPPEDEPPTELFPDIAPAPVEVAPKTNFAVAAMVLHIEVTQETPYPIRDKLRAIAAWLNEHIGKKPEEALAFLQMVLQKERWIKEPGGLLTVLPNYAGGVA